MNRSAIKRFATWARKHLLEQIAAKATQYGITEHDIATPQIVAGGMVLNGQTYDQKTTQLYLGLRQHLERQLEHHSLKTAVETLIDDMAYTWFNRLAALRYMEANDYLEKVLSSSQEDDTVLLDPDLLRNASSLIASGELGRVTLAELESWRKQGDNHTYSQLLNAQCQSLAESLPYLFKARSYAALFLPTNLLNQDSLVRRLVADIAASDWQDIEIIGWLYQFYISDKKDEVIGAKSQIEAPDIPAATQLFTPHWIVRYMVENSVGRLWLESHPESNLKAHMPYYLESETSENQAAPNAPIFGGIEGKALTPVQAGLGFGASQPIRARSEGKVENPQDLTVLDPACGSGHILVYAFDLLYLIYQEQGYPDRDIASLILEHNLFGLDIDERAVQLASFALLMKARARNRRILRNPPRLNLLAIEASDTPLPDVPELNKEDWQPLLDAFKDADNLGSLISPPDFDHDSLRAHLDAFAHSGRTQVGDLPQLEQLLAQARLLSQRYQAVVANPPYMGNKNLNKISKKFLEDNYQKYKSDLFSAFVIRCLELASLKGQLGFMTPFVWMFISSYEDLRKTIIEEHTLSSLVQLEYSGFDGATVPICTFTLKNEHLPNYTGDFIRLSDFRGSENQGPKTLEAAQNPDVSWRYRAQPKNFEKIPGSPIAYWVSEKVLEAFDKLSNIENFAVVTGGMTTANNDRFLRFWQEVSILTIGFNIATRETALQSQQKWFPYTKGGSFRRWFGNELDVVNWENDGSEIRKALVGKNPNIPRSVSHYFKKGLTWGSITSANFSARYSPPGSIFDVGGSKAFPSDKYRMTILGLLNSKLTELFLKTLNPTLNFQVGDLKKIPVLNIDSLTHIIEPLIQNSIKITRQDWDNFETSWDFQSHPLLRGNFRRVAEAFEDWRVTSDEAFFELKRLEEENNRYWIEAYGLQDELSPEVPEEQITIRRADLERDVKSLVSFAVGCMMGRYSLSNKGLVYAGGEFDMSRYPEEFKPDDDGIIPITDAAYFDDDISLRFERFLKVAFDEACFNENLDFVADALGRRSNETSREAIRRYFLNDFISDHIRSYSKRPIYWLFTSGKNKAFNALIYLHRYSPDTLAKLRTGYLLELQTKLAGELERLENEYEAAESASAKKAAQRRLKDLNEQILELRDYLDKVQHAADKRIDIDLDDGVAYNYTLFEGLVYEASDLKMADMKSKSQWKRDLLKEQAKALNLGV